MMSVTGDRVMNQTDSIQNYNNKLELLLTRFCQQNRSRPQNNVTIEIFQCRFHNLQMPCRRELIHMQFLWHFISMQFSFIFCSFWIKCKCNLFELILVYIAWEIQIHFRISNIFRIFILFANKNNRKSSSNICYFISKKEKRSLGISLEFYKNGFWVFWYFLEPVVQCLWCGHFVYIQWLEFKQFSQWNRVHQCVKY